MSNMKSKMRQPSHQFGPALEALWAIAYCC